MTQYTNPSPGGDIDHEADSAVARWGDADWIVPSGTDLIASEIVGLDGAPLNGASISTSGLDVTIDTFEALIGGAYVASDAGVSVGEREHTLPGNNTSTELYLGYDYSTANSFIFGDESEFASSDPKLRIARVVDDGSTITDVYDRRPLGYLDRPGEVVGAAYDTGPNVPLRIQTGTISNPYDVYDVYIYRAAQDSTESYSTVRINGSSQNQYSYTYFDASALTFDELTDQPGWGFVAGVDLGSGGNAGIATQCLRIACPRQVVANGAHYPTIASTYTGLGQGVSYLCNGSYTVDTGAINQIQVVLGGDATGTIEVRGLTQGYGGV